MTAKHEHKFTCERWNHNDESPDGRNSRHWLTCEVSGCSEWIWQFPSPDDYPLDKERLAYVKKLERVAEAAKLFHRFQHGEMLDDCVLGKALQSLNRGEGEK